MKISNRAARTAPARWAFRSKFRRGAFGWRGSKLAVERIDEALASLTSDHPAARWLRQVVGIA